MFLGILDLDWDPIVRDTAPDKDPSIIKKIVRKTLMHIQKVISRKKLGVLKVSDDSSRIRIH
jgi:hypothetical protein